MYNPLLFERAHLRFIARGTITINNEWSYKTLMVIQYILPLILFVFSFSFPESAYFLIKEGKIEVAKKALRRTYSSKDPEFLEIEFKRLTENVRFSEELKTKAAIGGPTLYQCFRGTNLVIPSFVFSNVRDVP